MTLSHCIDTYILPYILICIANPYSVRAGAVYVRMCVHACFMYTCA